MLLVYASRTNNIERLMQKLNLINTKKLETGEEIINQDFLLLTYTDMLGQVPNIVKNFLRNNGDFLKYVSGSGNKNFGNNFCKAAKIISQKYDVPLLMEFEFSGNELSIEQFKNKIISIGCF